MGLHTKFYECKLVKQDASVSDSGEDDGDVCLAVVAPRPEHQSYPNRMHGGVIAALLDETIGRAHSFGRNDIWGVTIELTVKYRRPVPLDTTLYAEGRITKINSRGFEGSGKLFTPDGKVCATAVGRYLNAPIESIAGAALGQENWFLEKENLPEYIVIDN